jgi:hypothetical protein
MPKTEPVAPAEPDVAAEVEALVAEQRAMRKALAAAEAKAAEAERALDAARHNLADAEAEALMRAASLPDDAPEVRAYAEAERNLDAARAASGGLKRKICETHVAVLSAAEKLKAEREEYNRRIVAEFLAGEFRPAAEAYRRVLRRAHALASALGLKLSPSDPDDTLGACLRVPSGSDEWNGDQDAVALHRQRCGLKDLAGALEEFRRDAELRLLVEEKNRQHRAAFDPTAKYQVIRPFQSYGREFAVGEVVDAHTIHSALLGKLYEAKRLLMLQRGDEWSR